MMMVDQHGARQHHRVASFSHSEAQVDHGTRTYDRDFSQSMALENLHLLDQRDPGCSHRFALSPGGLNEDER